MKTAKRKHYGGTMNANILSAYILLAKANNWTPTVLGLNKFNSLIKRGYIDSKTFKWK